MSAGLVIAEVNGRAESLQRVFIALRDLFEGGLQLIRVGSHEFFEMMAVLFEFLFEMAFGPSIFKTGRDRAFAKRFDEIIVRAGAHGFDAHGLGVSVWNRAVRALGTRGVLLSVATLYWIPFRFRL